MLAAQHQLVEAGDAQRSAFVLERHSRHGGEGQGRDDGGSEEHLDFDVDESGMLG